VLSLGLVLGFKLGKIEIDGVVLPVPEGLLLGVKLGSWL
jgi:hypothetical protein